jgi:hypothetical protein
MTSPLPVFVAGQFDMAEQIKAQDAAVRELAKAAAVFLRAAFPHVSATCVDNLGTAFVGLLCCGTEQQLASIERNKEMLKHYPPPTPWELPSDEEQLIELIEARDKMAERILQVERGMDSMPEEIRGMVEATSLTILRDELAVVEKRIASVQKSIERIAALTSAASLTISE